MIRCRELVELVTAYLDDALRPEQRASVEAHLAKCDGCRGYLEQFRATIAVIRRTGQT